MSVASPSISKISWIGNLFAILNSALRCASPDPPVTYVVLPCLPTLGGSNSSAACSIGTASASNKPVITPIFVFISAPRVDHAIQNSTPDFANEQTVPAEVDLGRDAQAG